MFPILKQHLAGLTLLALSLGLLIGFVVAKTTLSPHILKEDAFIREVDRGSRMTVIVRTKNLAALVADRTKLGNQIQAGEVLILRDADVLVPDTDAASFLG
jgi:hypothetical protein